MDIREHFPELETMDVVMLHSRREEILSSVLGAYDKLEDDLLAELLQITRCLRRKAAAPGGAPRTKKPKTPATLDDLA